MRHLNKIELVGTVKNVNVQRCDSTRRVKISVETEDLHEGVKHQLPVTFWESKNNSLDLLATGTSVHVVGRIRGKNLTTAYRRERTVHDIIASQVEIM